MIGTVGRLKTSKVFMMRPVILVALSAPQLKYPKIWVTVNGATIAEKSINTHGWSIYSLKKFLESARVSSWVGINKNQSEVKRDGQFELEN